MERAAEELRFERAAELRDRIQAIELLGMRQKVVAGPWRIPTSPAFTGDSQELLRGPALHGGGSWRPRIWTCWRPPWRRTRRRSSSLVREYYVGRSRLPRQILLPCELPDQVPLTRMLSEQVGRQVELVTPQRGQRWI